MKETSQEMQEKAGCVGVGGMLTRVEDRSQDR